MVKIKLMEPEDWTGEIYYTIGNSVGSMKIFKARYEKEILKWANHNFPGVEKNLEYDVQKMDKNDYVWTITIRLSAQ